LIYRGKNILPFLLRWPESLNNNEIDFIKQFYNDYSIPFIKELVLKENIVPFASHIFIFLKCDESYWKKEHDLFLKRNTIIKSTLDSIFNKSNSAGIKSLTLTENFASLLLSKSCLGCFSSGDVDLSADISEKDKIILCMKSVRFFVDKRKKSSSITEKQCTMFYNDSIIDSGLWINVVWVSVTRSFLDQKKFNTRLYSSRLNPTIIDNTDIRVLSPTSLLYFCALHIAAGHYYTLSPGIRLYVDIDRLVLNFKINWDQIIKWEKEDNSGIRISMVLFLCKNLLKTKIPNKVFKKILDDSAELKSYLYNPKSMMIQKNGGRINRLYVELASKSRNLVTFLIERFVKSFVSSV
tara:strand:- start:57 stop:1112 length:1056 start_codon:yes stop_codon:yes gene_type:complete